MHLTPETGRKHQLHQHMRHLFHHIVGNTSHSDGRNNRFFWSQYGCERMLVHAQILALSHPVTGEPLLLTARLDDQWLQIFEAFDWVESAEGSSP